MISRRSVLGAAAGVVAGAVAGSLPGESASAAPILDKPGTLVRAAGAVAGSNLVASTQFALTHLAVAWQGPAAGAALRTRTTSGWSPWRAVAGCGGGFGDDLAAARTNGSVLAAPNALGYELLLPSGAVDPVVHELNTSTATVDRPATAPKPGIAAMIPSPYYTRAMWGADESLRFKPDGTEIWPNAYFPVQTLTVHHAGDGVNDIVDPLAHVRGIYYQHTVTNGWGDYGYHLSIDEQGRVYEGRYSGTDHIPVFGPELTSTGRPMMVNAAHSVGYNAGNIGVGLLGDFTNRQPTRAARRTLTYVLAALSVICDLDPAGRTHYVNPVSGAVKDVDTITSHRNWIPTECPGNAFYPYMGDVRRDVARLVGPLRLLHGLG